MATKNLARTAIEGGRYWATTFRCRYENGALRANTRTALARVTTAHLDADDWAAPRVEKLGRDFDDKLSVPERWLEAQVGRPWRLVRSELLRRFDPRTTAGRHLVFDHMLPWVRGFGAAGDGGERFAVDAHGLLRRLARRYYGRRIDPPAPLPRPEREISTWLSGRRVGARDDVYFWFIPTAHGGYRQHRRLDDRDAALWCSLPGWFQRCHDSFAAPRATQRQ